MNKLLIPIKFKPLIHFSLCFLMALALLACKGEKETEDITKTPIPAQISEDYEPRQFQKIGLVYQHPGKHMKDEIEVYVSKKGDTLLNQVRRIKNGKIVRSASKFYTLTLKGTATDSVLKATLKFFAPADTIPQQRLKERQVTFTYLQRVGNTMKWQDITTDTNVIQFDFKPFNKKVFIGFIADYRYFKVDGNSDQFLLIKNFYAVDTEKKTKNPFIPLLKKEKQAR